MIESILENLPEFLSDAIIDSVKLIPSLIVIFVFIEIFENYFAHKITNIVSFSRRLGPIFGAILAVIPQCGFSVIMTTLFVKRYITLGTLLSVYIATSDEAIPVLLANPSETSTVIKIIVIKLCLAIITGYLVDLFIKTRIHTCKDKHRPCMHLSEFEPEVGCCSHKINEDKIKNIIIHPIKHTLIIFSFILVICIGLNFIFAKVGEDIFTNFASQSPILETAIFSVFGLVPNCAVSVLITMMFLIAAWIY